MEPGKLHVGCLGNVAALGRTLLCRGLLPWQAAATKQASLVTSKIHESYALSNPSNSPLPEASAEPALCSNYSVSPLPKAVAEPASSGTACPLSSPGVATARGDSVPATCCNVHESKSMPQATGVATSTDACCASSDSKFSPHADSEHSNAQIKPGVKVVLVDMAFQEFNSMSGTCEQWSKQIKNGEWYDHGDQSPKSKAC